MPGVVSEYIVNMRGLLRDNPKMFGIMVERQVQGRLLKKLRGKRVDLEPQLWELLIFCLNGHEALAPPLDENLFSRAEQAATDQGRLDASGPACYPKAAQAVLRTMLVLREVGMYPPSRF